MSRHLPEPQPSSLTLVRSGRAASRADTISQFLPPEAIERLRDLIASWVGTERRSEEWGYGEFEAGYSSRPEATRRR